MKIVFGISGSIAAYRASDLVKQWVAEGHEIQCVLTKAAEQFVSEKVLEVFSGKRVLHSDPFGNDHQGTDHISAARWADAFVVYGATANTIAKAAGGLADDFLSLQLLAFGEGPILFVPAMNPTMWQHEAVQENVRILKRRGVQFVGPISGTVACGESGVGHVADAEAIDLALQRVVEETTGSSPVPALAGKRVLISAGPMRTYIDPVRYIQNRSSGKMGLALARECRRAGATVTVLLGPVLADLAGEYAEFRCVRYEVAEEYERGLRQEFDRCDVFFSAAAVLDFDCVRRAAKMGRKALQSGPLELEIRTVPDYVGMCARSKRPDQQVIAFAAEVGTPTEVLDRATQKLAEKQTDAILANAVSADSGPDSDENEMWLLRPGAPQVHFGRESKSALARRILQALYL